MSLVVEFLSSIRTFLLEAKGDELRKWLQVEPNAPDSYYQLAQELKTSFPPQGDSLEKLIDKCLPEEDNIPEGKGSPWPGFNSFIKEYLQYWRDVNFNDIVRLHPLLSELVNSCANAFANPTYGVLLLETSMSLSEALSKLVMNIVGQPDLVLEIEEKIFTIPDDDDGEEKSIVELAADIIQKFFSACLTDRSSSRWSTPKGKKTAVYLFANLTLKLLFKCDKSQIGAQMFTNMDAMGPALSLYPASQRVTYLYYLGRFHFDTEDYWSAHKTLEEAYRQCPPQFLKQRRRILLHWIPSNLLLARFPSVNLLQRPEAEGFAEVYIPICAAVRTGNWLQFLEVVHQRRDWLADRGFYVLIYMRLRALVWRSFTRKIFILKQQLGLIKDQVPSLSFSEMVAMVTYVQKLLEGYTLAPKRAPVAPKRAPHINTLFMKAVTNSAVEGGLVAPPGGPRTLLPNEGLIFGNAYPDLVHIESILAGLAYAGLLNGYIAPLQGLFVVEGTKQSEGDPVAAGWPNPHESILQRFKEVWTESVEKFETGEIVEHPGDFDAINGWVRDSPEMG